jgi:cobalt-zinc-cadmium efflux system outer membrane protein
MRARIVVGTSVNVLLVILWQAASLDAQRGPGPAVAQVASLSIDDAVRVALERNQTLRAQRLIIEAAKADAVTAGLKPNFNLSFGTSGLSVFSPRQFTYSTVATDVTYDAGLSYTFERGGKRAKRITLAEDAIDMAGRSVVDAERQVRFQTEQAFISVLLAKATLDVARQDLKTFSDFVDINEQRVRSGDLSELDFLPISIQRLQFEADVSAAELDLVQTKAALRQLVGFDSVSDDFDVTGELVSAAPAIGLDELKREALASRPDLLAAQRSVKAAQDSAALERARGARDVEGGVGYSRVSGGNTMGGGVSFDLPFHDQNQGNIARADVAVQQATEMVTASRFLVLTDVASAFAAFQTSARIAALYESGYLDQARRSLEITTFAFQRGASSLLAVLDAERTYRDVQLKYRQALATLMTNVRQLNFVVGKQVVK